MAFISQRARRFAETASRATMAAMDATTTAWLILLLGYLLPLAHVALSPAGGPWRPPPGARCPFGPRAGWLVVVLLTGIFGWLLYLAARLRRRAPNA